MSQQYVENQNDVRLRGLTAFNPFSDTVSSSRGQMQSNALTQHYVINGCQPNSIQTGVEQEYGNYTYSIKTEQYPEDCGDCR